MQKTLKQKALSAFLTAALAIGCVGTIATVTELSSPQTAQAANAWQQSGSRWWYQKGSSYSVGWDKINGSWYYFDNAGWMKTGWQKVNGTWYYLNPSGAMATGWKQVGGVWYYLNDSGAMQTGWNKIGDTWYYLNSGGDMAAGWNKVGNDWYYHNASGAMQANKWIGDYYVGSSGAMATNTWIGNYYVGSDGKWRQNTSSTTGNTGWKVENHGPGTTSHWVYYDENGNKVYNQWVDGYYLDEYGKMATNTVIDGKYVVGADGKLERAGMDWALDSSYSELEDGTLSIHNISCDFGGDITIPDQINGKYVAEVCLGSDGSFAWFDSWFYISSIDFSQASHLNKIRLINMHFLTSVNLSNCTNLKSLYIQDTHIKQLDLTGCESLTDLDFRYTRCNNNEYSSENRWVCRTQTALANPTTMRRYPYLKYTDPTLESITLPNHGQFVHKGSSGIAGLMINNKGEWVNLNNYPVYNLPDPSICEPYPSY